MQTTDFLIIPQTLPPEACNPVGGIRAGASRPSAAGRGSRAYRDVFGV